MYGEGLKQTNKPFIGGDKVIYDFQGLKPVLDSTVFVAPGVHIIGDVHIKEYSSIWFNCTVRGDLSRITIGSHVNIQDNSVIHVDTNLPTQIGDHVVAGHNVIIHGSKIGSGCLVGMGSLLLDGSVIGENSLIGAGSLVKQDQEIPPGVLALGRPARVIRGLTQEEINSIRLASQGYSQRAQMYKNQLKSL